ncbi:tRNA nuclease WapA precursor [compost metagenome]
MNGTGYKNSYTYENDNLKTINHNGFNYEFFYEKFGNVEEIKVSGNRLVKNYYQSQNGNLEKTKYGNNQEWLFEYDRFGRLIKKTGENTSGTIFGSFYYSYDAKGNLASQKDDRDNNITYYTYDLADRLVKSKSTDGLAFEYGYDKNSNINKVVSTLNDTTNTTEYNLDADNKPTSVKISDNNYLVYNYDRLSRLDNKTIKTQSNSYISSMKYIDNENDASKTTTLLSSITNAKSTDNELTKADNTISYTYDKNGNIETITKGSMQLAKYYYDKINQLVREDNLEQNKTITYSYDNGGNLLNKKTYNFTTDSDLSGKTVNSTNTFTYGDTSWKDKLTKFDNKSINYDNIGNMTSFDGASFTWEMGRQLASITKTGLNIQYKYNDSGIRTSKTVNGVTTNYYLNGDKVVYEKRGTDTIYYTYDAESNLIGFKYKDTQYYYVRNGQGDIIEILDNNLNNVVSYTYDSWGKLISIKNASGQDITSDKTSIGYINEYRYRGYRYDNETSMYYLNSRYYNPELCRFINADAALGQIGNNNGHNMFQYCFNNPINMDDPSGCWPKLSTVLMGVAIVATGVAITSGVGAVVSKTVEKSSNRVNDKSHTVYKLIDDTGKTVYVGRTVNPEARAGAHNALGSKTAGLTFIPIASGLTYSQARGVEQIAMLEYNTKNCLNSINGISPNNPRRDIYMAAGRQFANYIGNQISNEILYWAGI